MLLSQKLRNLFVKFLDTSQRRHNVVTVCGGSPDEKMMACRLASGCSVLICSPPSFIRICNANYVDLIRLYAFVCSFLDWLVVPIYIMLIMYVAVCFYKLRQLTYLHKKCFFQIN